MKNTNLARLILPLAMGGVWSGCDDESGILRPNEEPNTRISSGPLEATDTGYNVNLFWYGWDEDGFIDYYEIAWEKPEDWFTPIFGNDSLFSVQASETCCVEPLPDFGEDLRDSVYEQFHTFFVRAVDDNGVPDPTPAYRSFNAKTIAPFTEISFGPATGGQWGTSVQFAWVGEDDDGVVESYKYALSDLQEWRIDMGITDPRVSPPGGIGELFGWLDTLTYVPSQPDSPAWKPTVEDSVSFDLLPTPPPSEGVYRYLFAVRAIDNAGAEERILDSINNTRVFTVSAQLDGPKIWLSSNIVGTWRTPSQAEPRDVFNGQGIRFNWAGTPGPSQAPVAGFSYAIDDTTTWTPFSINSVEWPDQPTDPDAPENLWFPPAGPHTFFLRAIDFGGFINLLVAKLRVFSGPTFCDDNEQMILVILDTSSSPSLRDNGFWPRTYTQVEREIVSSFFEGFNFQIHETRGNLVPKVSLLNCATSTFWFHGGDADADDSILRTLHADPPNPLPSYIASGGNFFLCGVRPSAALAFVENVDQDEPVQLEYPLLFRNTIDDPQFAPHWAATLLGIARVEESRSNTNVDPMSLRLREARPRIDNSTREFPYPLLRFDPTRWPGGTRVRGFGFYDRGIEPLRGDPRFFNAETLYTANDTNIPVAIRKRAADGGIHGNVVYVGFHPYFIDQPAAKALIRAALKDFGENPSSVP
jgi:hypothetical protein